MRLETQLCDQSVPIRTCAGCGKRDARGKMLRVVADPDGHLKVDLRRALPGRGAWVHQAPSCVAQARKRRAFPRILKISASVMEDYASENFWEELAYAALSEAPRVPEHE